MLKKYISFDACIGISVLIAFFIAGLLTVIPGCATTGMTPASSQPRIDTPDKAIFAAKAALNGAMQQIITELQIGAVTIGQTDPVVQKIDTLRHNLDTADKILSICGQGGVDSVIDLAAGLPGASPQQLDICKPIKPDEVLFTVNLLLLGVMQTLPAQ